MSAILMLLIIIIQFGILYFGVKYLSALNEKIIKANSAVIEIKNLIPATFIEIKIAIKKINKYCELFFTYESKIKVARNIFMLRSLIVALFVFKKRKNIKKIFSIYSLVRKFTKALLEL